MTGAAKKKVVVAMSGGVDSSVAAALLLEQGFEVVGCFMRLGSEDESEQENVSCKPETAAKSHRQGCCSVNDAHDARLVAAMLGIPLYVLNFRNDFGRIVRYFVDEYNAGRTPNPCVRCNDWLKFGKLMDYAASIDASHVATGHYARIAPPAGPGEAPQLFMGKDRQKDQSYVLFGQHLDRLSRILLPIGEFDKTTIRQMAADRGLPVFNKPDSQEICFVPDNDYAGLISRHTPEAVSTGDLVDTDGRALGHHPGQQHFTVGQRRGLGVSLGYPLYVVNKDAASNTVTVGSADDLLVDALEADQTNWLIDLPREPLDCHVKIRSNMPPRPATLQAIDRDHLRITFAQPCPAVGPGQAAVAYVGERLIAGGWISQVTTHK